MKLPDLQKWISGVEAQRGDLASASSSTVDNFDSRPRKRRRLDFDSTPRKRAKSDADIDYYIPPSLSLSRAVPCPRRATDVGGMAGQKRSMGPPESPSRSRRSKSRRSSDADAETITSRSSSAAPGTVTTGYRPKVLRPNGILFEHPAKTLPNCVQDALHQYEMHGLDNRSPSTSRTTMTSEQATP